MKALLIPLSPDNWESKEMMVVVQQAKDSARKIRKGIDVRLERKRFSNACDRIEELALNYEDNNFLDLEDDKIQQLLDKLQRDGGTQFPFFEPIEVKQILQNGFSTELKNKIPSNGGIVAILEPFAKGNISFRTKRTKKIKKIKPLEPDYSASDVDLTQLDSLNSRFHYQIRTAIETGNPLGWINVEGGGDIGLVKHEALVTAIREYIYVKEQPTKIEMVKVTKEVPDEEATRKRNSKLRYRFLPFLIPKNPIMKKIKVNEPKVIKLPIEPINIRFAYSDGSIGDEFPLFCLAPKKAPEGLPVINAALISNRHFELDPKIDVCIIRNSEISRREDASIAEQEQLSFEIAHRFLHEYLKKSIGLELHLYHTGLEPAVIGTYRAILEILRKSDSKYRDKLIVIPKMFRGHKNGFRDLKAWF